MWKVKNRAIVGTVAGCKKTIYSEQYYHTINYPTGLVWEVIANICDKDISRDKCLQLFDTFLEARSLVMNDNPFAVNIEEIDRNTRNYILSNL